MEQSPPIVALYRRAQDGVSRRDWKLAIDSLQRIVDELQAQGRASTALLVAF